MGTAGTGLMAKPKGRPKAKAADQEPRTTVLNLKGSREQAEWLDAIHRKSNYSKAVIARLALNEWALRNGYPAIPTSVDD